MKVKITLNDTLFELANISGKLSGIINVVIWIGEKPNEHGHRIKVSNVANKYSDDNFTIVLHDFSTIGKINTKLITKNVFEQIINFIKVHKVKIIEYSTLKIFTDEFKSYLREYNKEKE